VRVGVASAYLPGRMCSNTGTLVSGPVMVFTLVAPSVNDIDVLSVDATPISTAL